MSESRKRNDYSMSGMPQEPQIRLINEKKDVLRIHLDICMRVYLTHLFPSLVFPSSPWESGRHIWQEKLLREKEAEHLSSSLSLSLLAVPFAKRLSG
jgi:hypothetical protein